MTVIEAPIAPHIIEAEILERAADILEEWGHCKKYMFYSSEPDSDVFNLRIDGPTVTYYCGIGAIWRAAFERGLIPGTWQELCESAVEPYDLIGQTAGLSFPEVAGLASYNDTEITQPGWVGSTLRAKALERRAGALSMGEE